MNKTLLNEFETTLNELCDKADKIRRDFESIDKAKKEELRLAGVLKRNALICRTVQKYIAAGCGRYTAICDAADELYMSPQVVWDVFNIEKNLEPIIKKRAAMVIISKMTAARYPRKAIARVIGCSEKYVYDLIKQCHESGQKICNCAVSG